MTVRSTRLGFGQIASGAFHSIYTCPAGWRTIVKSVNVDNSGGAATNVTILAQNASGSTNANLALLSLTNNTAYLWSGWVVLNPADQLFLYSSAAALDYWASGTLLQLTGSEPI